MTHDIFITGGTGYIGRPLMSALVAGGHRLRALVRPGSERKLPPGVEPVTGNVLDASTWAGLVAPAETLIHLIGTPHPSPSKAAEFERVDLASVRESVSAAVAGGVSHIVYVSVAHPAPVMHAYINSRVRGEALVRDSGIPATILRPWYVLGPGHRWPYALVPVYLAARLIPATRAGAQRLGLVSRGQMVAALVRAVAQRPAGVRVVEVPEIRTGGIDKSIA